MTLHEWRAMNPLRLWRKRAGVTKGYVARRVPCTWQCVHFWERGDRIPNNDNFVGIYYLSMITERQWRQWHDHGKRLSSDEA